MTINERHEAPLRLSTALSPQSAARVYAESLLEMIEWADGAACAGHPQRDDFTRGGSVAAKLARTVCADCPVREACLDYGIAHKLPGVYGGTTALDRKREGWL